jgi:hypothetical protein
VADEHFQHLLGQRPFEVEDVAAVAGRAQVRNARSMSESRSDVVAASKRKAIAAGVTTAAAVTLGVVGWPVTAVVAAVPAAVLGYRWWQHRVANGIRF